MIIETFSIQNTQYDNQKVKLASFVILLLNIFVFDFRHLDDKFHE
jgi:hypothetical protein